MLPDPRYLTDFLATLPKAETSLNVRCILRKMSNPAICCMAAELADRMRNIGRKPADLPASLAMALIEFAHEVKNAA